MNAVKTCIAMLAEWHSVCSLMGWEPNHLKAFSDAEAELKTLAFTAKELREHNQQGYEKALANYRDTCDSMGLTSDDFEQIAATNYWRYRIDGTRWGANSTLEFPHRYGNRSKK